MKVQQISFKNNLNQPEQKSNSGSVTSVLKPDKFESSNKKDTTAKYIFAGLGVVAAIVAIVKRKQIGEFFSKWFKRGEKPGENLEPQKPPIIDSTLKSELPKPEFKYDETNPVEFAEEKDAYMETIIPYARKDENIAHDVMEQFNEHGSSKFLMDLATDLSISGNKTDKMVRDFLQQYKKFGLLEQPPEINEDCDASLLSFILDEFEKVISKDSMILMIKEFKRTGNDALALTEVRSFSESKAQNPFLNKFTDEELNEISKSARDAEPVILSRFIKKQQLKTT